MREGSIFLTVLSFSYLQVVSFIMEIAVHYYSGERKYSVVETYFLVTLSYIESHISNFQVKHLSDF